MRAQGDGFARGIHIGKELVDLVQASVGFYHRYLDRRGISSEQLSDLLTPYLFAAETSYPESMNVLKGMSIGAMVPILELFAINAFEELEPQLESPEGELLFLQRKEGYLKAPPPPAPGAKPPPGANPTTPGAKPPFERCSSVSVKLADTTLIAHNEHWLAGDLGNVAVMIDLPEDGRVPVASPTVVCCLPAVGMNAHGGGQGIGSLNALDDGVGVPRVLVSRSSLEARSRADAIARAAMPGRAGGYGHVYRLPRRRVHGGDHRPRASGARSRRTPHQPLPGPRARRPRSPALGGKPSAPDATARTGRRTSARVAGGPDGHDARSRLGSAVHLPAPRAETEGEEASAVMFSMVADVGNADVDHRREPVRPDYQEDRPVGFPGLRVR